MSDNLRLNSATVLDDTTDSGKLLKQCTHLLKSHLQTTEYDRTAELNSHISSVNNSFVLNCRVGGSLTVGLMQTNYYKF